MTKNNTKIDNLELRFPELYNSMYNISLYFLAILSLCRFTGYLTLLLPIVLLPLMPVYVECPAILMSAA